MSPCESADNTGEPSVLEEPRGPLPLNKTLFLGYAFLLTMATTSDKLTSRSKLLDGPTGSSEEEEGRFPGALIHALSCHFLCEAVVLFVKAGEWVSVYHDSGQLSKINLCPTSDL